MVNALIRAPRHRGVIPGYCNACLILLLCLCASTGLRAQAPSLITYQGRVSNAGTPVNGPGRFKFALVDPGTAEGSQATATATVVNGFIVAITVTSGGSGYPINPKVTLSHPKGTGASAVAHNVGGSIASVQVISAGSGYTDDAPVVVTIDPPPVAVDYTTYWSHDATSTGGGEPAGFVTLPVSQGIFSVMLGDTTLPGMGPLSPAVLAHPDVRLRIWFSAAGGAFQLLSPDQRLTSAPYAALAGGVSDGVITAAKLAAGSITADKLSPALTARLDGPPSGGIVLSADPASASLVAGGYSRLDRMKVVQDEWEVRVAETGFNLGNSAFPITAVWTGTEALLVGQLDTQGRIGVRYNPVLNLWREVTTNGAPLEVLGFSTRAVWTGQELLVFSSTPDGLRGATYNPQSDQWTPINPVGAPAWDSIAGQYLWTGTDLVVAQTGPTRVTGGFYRPSTRKWTAFGANGGVHVDMNLRLAWTGSRLLVYGNEGAQFTGSQYDPATLQWNPMSPVGAPSFSITLAQWTGTELLVLGGATPDMIQGARYNPASNSWSPMDVTGAVLPSDPINPSYTWTGSELLVWNPSGVDGPYGARYRPATGIWTAMNRFAPAVSSTGFGLYSIWTGDALLYGFGDGFSTGVAAGRYDPATDRWSIVQGNGFTGSSAGMTVQRPTLVWTGTQVLAFVSANTAPSLTQYVFLYTPASPLYLYQRH